MLRGLMWWLLSALVLLAVFTLLKGNVDWLMWIIPAWFVGAAGWQAIRARRSRSAGGDAVSAPATPAESGNRFDPEFCGRITRFAAVCFVVMIVFEFILFSTVTSAKCPGWQSPTEKQGGSVWIIWFFAAFWTANIVYHAVTWRRVSQKILDKIEWGRRTYISGTNPTWMTDLTQFKARSAVKNDTNAVFILVLVLSAFFVALPILTRIGCF